MSGKKIIDSLKDAIAGNFSRVTIDGQVWERRSPPPDTGRAPVPAVPAVGGRSDVSLDRMTESQYRARLDALKKEPDAKKALAFADDVLSSLIAAHARWLAAPAPPLAGMTVTEALKPGSEIQVSGQRLFVLSVKDYDRLLIAAEGDDMLLWCETCGAWIDRDDPAAAHTEDFDGCWKAATRREQDSHLCRSYRVSEAREKIRKAERALSSPTGGKPEEAAE